MWLPPSTEPRNAAAGSPGQFAAHGFVPVAGVGLLEGAVLAQCLELVGVGGDPLRIAYSSLPFGGGLRPGGELGPDDVVGVRVVHGARRGGSPAEARPPPWPNHYLRLPQETV
ncbi:hypothetical protein [Streptomyces sp. WAC04114]|uniref:hypothetical protein n=1 Tax=Streptomyces sp. WAC04114 TaxID=2867961 RepID=UPI001C8B5895|nr:hypothetical protein [Streptomyces sp. WAC04114]MBX9366165.1 hypothetical protein [Streptomyces sp. WAC04114]